MELTLPHLNSGTAKTPGHYGTFTMRAPNLDRDDDPPATTATPMISPMRRSVNPNLGCVPSMFGVRIYISIFATSFRKHPAKPEQN
jgi:hypothetical protein